MRFRETALRATLICPHNDAAMVAMSVHAGELEIVLSGRCRPPPGAQPERRDEQMAGLNKRATEERATPEPETAPRTPERPM